ncbi:MAG: PEP-CTERM sorting domain-containing protein [Chloroherpetonaceae bacterium]|nr:PEP-CTERM sorting domain-containing protein [Chthonomonadaceae bacterium]MDW8209127.1 PEP-CTERM sorting domain-containing protein [Chloroherpetonaceae bacterium]
MAFRTLSQIGLAGLLTLACHSFANAQLRINEFLINPPGSDNGYEFIELISNTPNYSLNNVWLLVVEGEGTARGVVDQAINYTGFSTGSNGLLLHRDSNITLLPPPDPSTTVRVQDFVPDIENGGQTYILALGFTGAVGLDLDTNNDGVLDLTPWTSVFDAIFYSEDLPNPLSANYADDLGGTSFAQQIFTPDAYALLPDGTKIAFDVLSASPVGPFDIDPAEVITATGAPFRGSYRLTPGSANVPEPGVMALIAGLGVTGLLALRRRKA